MDMYRHHAAVWGAIEAVARRQKLSCSGLATLAGLDKTSFNPSKRTVRGGHRWPSTETVAAVLAATGITWEKFGQMVTERME